MFKKIIVTLSVLFVIGLIQNPENLYTATEIEMTAIDVDHLQAPDGTIYVADRELFTGETYIVKLETHPDRKVIAEYWEKGE